MMRGACHQRIGTDSAVSVWQAPDILDTRQRYTNAVNLMI